jgi:acyl-CoA synthetase (NDP forming)
MPASVAEELADRGVPALGGIPTALLALKAHTAPSRSAADLRATAAATQAINSGDSWLAEHEAKALLRPYGVTAPDGVVVSTPEDAVAAGRTLGNPVALKVSHPSLQHKSDVGGVLLGLDTPSQIREGAEQLIAVLPGASLLLEKMAQPGVEMLVAATRDGVVPALVVGMGGIWTELLDDAVLIPLPADVERVTHALSRLRGISMLTGMRGQQALAVDALAQIAVAAGRALVEEPLHLVELNPVIVSQNSAVAVDAVVRTLT